MKAGSRRLSGDNCRITRERRRGALNTGAASAARNRGSPMSFSLRQHQQDSAHKIRIGKKVNGAIAADNEGGEQKRGVEAGYSGHGVRGVHGTDCSH